MRAAWMALASVMAAMPAVAAAQNTIAAPADAGWKHVQTGVMLPARLLGIARDQLRDNSASQIDVSAGYGDNQATTVTLYVFRPSLMSVPIWFDRSETQILVRDVFGHASPQGPAMAFAAPGGSVNAGLRRIYVPEKGPYKSTGLAIVPLGDWLVAIRISSTEFDAAELDGKMSEVIAAIGWPSKPAPSPAATPIAACGAPLAYSSKAKLRKPDMSDSIMGSMLLGMGNDKTIVANAVPVTWCREGEGISAYGVYRPGADAAGYTLAMGDAGVTIGVTPGLPIGKGEPGYRLSIGLLDRTLILPSFDKLPTPEAAIQAAKSTPPTAAVPRGENSVTIFTK